jgi:hypothetical protein
MQFDDELERAMRAEDPGAAFTQRVLARAREERTRAARDTGTPASPEAWNRTTTAADATIGSTAASALPRMRRWAIAVAASIAIAAGGVQVMQYRRYVAEGERARAQVLAALRLTSEKLNRVHDALHEPAEREPAER